MLAAPKLAALYLGAIMRGLTAASHKLNPNSLQVWEGGPCVTCSNRSSSWVDTIARALLLQTLAASLLAQEGRQLQLCSASQWKDLVWGFTNQVVGGHGGHGSLWDTGASDVAQLGWLLGWIPDLPPAPPF